MAMTTLSKRLMQNDESVDRPKTKNALLHLDRPHFFSNAILNDILIYLYGCTSTERTYFVTYYVNNGLQKNCSTIFYK